jgi:pimeloyl-ACP methyl ester carboxylesterase
VVSLSAGARAQLWLAANHPDRVAGTVFIAPYLPLTRWQPVETMRKTYMEPRAGRRAARMILDTTIAMPRNLRSPSWRHFARHVKFLEGVRKFNGPYWLQDQRGFLEWNFGVLDLSDPHSTRQLEDSIEWGLDADAETLVDAFRAMDIEPDAPYRERDEILAACRRVESPVFVIQGEHDLATPPDWARALAKATGARYMEVPGSGHVPQARRPVVVNIALREFAESLS